MSAGEQHARVELLEQNPALLREVETVCEHTGTYVHISQQAGIDVQPESTSQASTLDDWPEPVPLGPHSPLASSTRMDTRKITTEDHIRCVLGHRAYVRKRILATESR